MPRIDDSSRQLTDQTLDQIQAMVATALKSLREVFNSAPTLPTAEFNAKAITYAESNVDRGFEYLRAVIHADNPIELWKLHAGFLKDQTTITHAQVQDLSRTALKTLTDVSPFVRAGDTLKLT